MRLTAEGEQFLSLFRKMYNTHLEMEQLSEEIRRRKKSDLNIAAASYFCTYILPGIIGDYNLEKPEVNIKVIESNDKEKVEFLRSGICDIGMASRELKDSETEAGLTATVIANDGIAVVVNNDNPIDELTSDQVKSVFTGETTTWADLEK